MPPEQPPMVPEPPTQHRVLSRKVLWIILLVIAIAVCAVWYRHSRLSLLGPGEPCIPTEVRDPNTNAYLGLEGCGYKLNQSTWQTYRNDEYGFEFMYPPGVLKPVQIKDKGNSIEFNYYGEMYNDYLTSFTISILNNANELSGEMAYVVSPDKKYIVTISRGPETPPNPDVIKQILSTFKSTE